MVGVFYIFFFVCVWRGKCTYGARWWDEYLLGFMFVLFVDGGEELY